MIQRLIQVLCLGWLFFLYFNTSLLTEAGGDQASQESVAPMMQPMQVAASSTIRAASSSVGLLKQTSKVNDNIARLEVDLSKRQVALYWGSTEIRQYPIAIGQKGWETPTGRFQVISMQEKPVWIHPLENKVVTTDDPENPLGRFWIGFWTDGTHWVGFHGTPQRDSVGKAVSHGCLRMYDEDIDELYYQVSTGTPVIVKR